MGGVTNQAIPGLLAAAQVIPLGPCITESCLGSLYKAIASLYSRWNGAVRLEGCKQWNGMEQWIMLKCHDIMSNTAHQVPWVISLVPTGMPCYFSFWCMVKGDFTPLVCIPNAQNEIGNYKVPLKIPLVILPVFLLLLQSTLPTKMNAWSEDPLPHAPTSWYSGKSWYEVAADKLQGTDDEAQGLPVNVILMIGCSFGCTGGAVWALTYYLLGLRWSAALILAVTLLWGAASAHLAVTKRSGFAKAVTAYVSTLVIMVLHVLYGGACASQGLLGVTYLGPLLIVVTEPSGIKKSLYFLAATVAANLLICVVQQVVGPERLTPQHVELSEGWRTAFLWLHPTVSGVCAYLFVATAILFLRKTRRRLELSHLRTARLNERLMRERERLWAQQELTQKLILNMFPRKTAVALLQAFETTADRNSPRSPDKYAPGPSRRGAGDGEARQESWASDPTDPAEGGRTESSAPSSETQEEPASEGPSSHRSRDAAAPGDEISRIFAPRLHSSAAILFADIVGFTELASHVSPTTLVHVLDLLFGLIDESCQRQNVEKIKTIGDCYMCVGWSEDDASPAETALRVPPSANPLRALFPFCCFAPLFTLCDCRAPVPRQVGVVGWPAPTASEFPGNASWKMWPFGHVASARSATTVTYVLNGCTWGSYTARSPPPRTSEVQGGGTRGRYGGGGTGGGGVRGGRLRADYLGIQQRPAGQV